MDKFFPLLLEITEEERKNRLERKEKNDWQRSKEKCGNRRKMGKLTEREHKAEMKRREELEQQSEQCTKSEYIYQFIREVESKIEIEQLTQEQVERFNEWKKWALEHADRLNPVRQAIAAITFKSGKRDDLV